MGKSLHLKTLVLAFAAMTFAGSAWADDEVETVLSANFGTEQTGWTSIDKSEKSGTTWKWTQSGYCSGTTWSYSNCVRLGRDWSSTHNDYYVSPALELQAGVEYSVKTLVGTSYNTAEACVTTTLELGTSSSDASTFTKVADLTTVAANNSEDFAEMGETHTLTVDADGTYYVAFHGVQETDDQFYGHILGIEITCGVKEPEVVEPHQPGDSIYSGTEASDFTIIDANNDGHTWGTVEGIDGLTYDSDQAEESADDWLVTSGIKLNAGTDYVISYEVAQQGAFDPDSVEIRLGDAATVEALTTLVGKDAVSNDGHLKGSFRYTSETAGTKFVGFHVFTPGAENGQLSLLSLNVVAIEAATPKAVTELAADIDSNDKKVTLSWNNPSEDTAGLQIVNPLSVKVYAGDELVETLTDQKAGAQTLEHHPATFAGDITYKVVAVIGDLESEAATVTVNLDDLSGDSILVHSFNVNSSTKGDWTIIDNGGSSTWGYDYQNIFTFTFKLGNGRYANDDWLISPAVALETGKRYVLKYDLKVSRDYDDCIAVTVGTAPTAEAQTQTVNDHKNLYQNGFATFTTPQFSVDETTDYYVGFHVYEATYSLSMRNLAVYYIGNSATGITDVAEGQGALAYDRQAAQLSVPAGSAVSVYAVNGAQTLSTATAATTVDLSSLAEGIYVVKATDQTGTVHTMKIVK